MTYNIYKLPKSEFYQYRSHLIMLDEESRYMRFGFLIKDETINQLYEKWRANIDQHVVFAIENENMEIVAVAHISLEDPVPELAFSVFKEYQGQGMGDALMKRAIEYCQTHGIKHGCMVCLSTNSKIKGLARKNGVLVSTDGTDSHGEIEIPDPTPVSYWKEYVDDSLGKLDHLGKVQRKFAQMFRFPLSF